MDMVLDIPLTQLCSLIGYLIDPHTAVAKTVADKMSLGSDGVPLVISATAHYSKFADSILKAVGLRSETLTDDAYVLAERASKLTDLPGRHKLLDDLTHAQRHKLVSYAHMYALVNCL